MPTTISLLTALITTIFTTAAITEPVKKSTGIGLMGIGIRAQ
ncbi:MAG: hypothetical protein ACHP65_09080 [Legionellales bacterium]